MSAFSVTLSCVIFFYYIVFNDLDLTVKSQVLGNGQTYLLGVNWKNIERFRLVMTLNTDNEARVGTIVSEKRPSV